MTRVFTTGVFDLFHIGHLNFLRTAKQLGDFLVVGVNTDEFVISYKKRCPIIPYIYRKEIVQACRWVDLTVKAEDFLPIKYLIDLDINVLAVSSEWKTKNLVSIEFAQQNGIEVKFIDYSSFVSTTKILNDIIRQNFERR
jgi:glycerol-3-phosphate cytidylyltransferase